MVAGLFLLALWEVHRALAGVAYETLWRAILSMPLGRSATAAVLAATAYLLLTGYDALALRYVRHPQSYLRTALASFIAFAFSNTIGLALLTGASVRTRLYSAWGLSTTVIGRIVAFGAATLWLGVLGVAGAAMLSEPNPAWPTNDRAKPRSGANCKGFSGPLVRTLPA